MSTLTDRLSTVWDERVATADFDLLGALDEVLGGVGMSHGDAGGEVTWTGADPVVPSPVRIGGAATICLLAKSVAAAALHRDRGGPGQDVSVDLRRAPHRLCPFYDRRWETLGGYPVTSTVETPNAMSFRFYRCRDGSYVMPQNMYPGLRRLAEELLGVPLTRDAVTAAIAQWDGPELERAAAEAGVVMPLVRTLPEMMATEQYRDVLADLPLIEVTKIADSDPEPLPALGEQPFSGLRALGMGHVIAGAGLGRSLALHGADVLNLWRPGEAENEVTYASANVGLRSSWLDPRRHPNRVAALLRDSDVFFHNRRQQFVSEIGMTPDEAAAARPGLVYVTVSLHGLDGPWAGRPGFDQSAGSVTGIMLAEGGGSEPKLPPIMVVNDYLVSWLAQVGVVAALRRRAADGGSYHVHVSLTRVALWILSLGLFDREWARSTADSGDERHRYLDPYQFSAHTPMGFYQGVTDQVEMSATPGRYDPVLVPRGSSGSVWPERGSRPDR